ncbi:MAG: hypothetical protein IJH04_01175 [Eggerthellaceae bacterium]|nr:hypothetical protein [Eggerthellaceae bacterium]
MPLESTVSVAPGSLAVLAGVLEEEDETSDTSTAADVRDAGQGDLPTHPVAFTTHIMPAIAATAMRRTRRNAQGGNLRVGVFCHLV